MSWGQAKSKLLEVLHDAAKGPTVIHSRGRDLAVILAVEDYERLIAEQPPTASAGAAFLQRVEGLKQRHGGGVSGFEPVHLSFVPVEPFARQSKGTIGAWATCCKSRRG